MLISVYTPSHNPRWLADCYASLQAQTHQDWEWVILLNGGALRDMVEAMVRDDHRVRVHWMPGVHGVGAAKHEAVARCSGDVLVELDHDDILEPSALAEVRCAFEEHPDAGMVYSQCANIDTEGRPQFTPFSLGHGWRYREAGGRTYPLTMAPTPHNVSHIWYAPNHLRAFTRVAYDKAGGYDPALDVLDDQDLMARLYTVGEFHLIDRPLYLQRQHADRTSAGADHEPQTDTNARIQVETLDMYDRTIQPAALAWAEREGLACLDLGGAHGQADPRYLTVDQHAAPGVDVVHTFPDLLWGDYQPNGTRLGADSSVGVIRAVDFLEHVADKVAMMNEIHRLLAPGGMLLSMTPSSEGWGADQDPTHVARWNPNSFWYFTDPAYANYVSGITAQFQVSRLTHGYPTEWHEANHIPYVTANLIAVKPGMPRNGGQLLWPTDTAHTGE